MQPPVKPPRRPLPDARGLPVARQDVIPGIPRQAASPRAVEAAREAARGSSPEVQAVRIEVLGHRIDTVEHGVERMEGKLDDLSAKVDEWELKAAGSESVKLQEEGKTKRLSVIVGLLTVALNAVITIGANVATRPMPAPHLAAPMSQNELDIAECKKKPSLDEQATCVREIVLLNIAPTH